MQRVAAGEGEAAQRAPQRVCAAGGTVDTVARFVFALGLRPPRFLLRLLVRFRFFFGTRKTGLLGVFFLPGGFERGSAPLLLRRGTVLFGLEFVILRLGVERLETENRPSRLRRRLRRLVVRVQLRSRLDFALDYLVDAPHLRAELVRSGLALERRLDEFFANLVLLEHLARLVPRRAVKHRGGDGAIVVVVRARVLLNDAFVRRSGGFFRVTRVAHHARQHRLFGFLVVVFFALG